MTIALFLSVFLSVLVAFVLLSLVLRVPTDTILCNTGAVAVFALTVAVISVIFLKILPILCQTALDIFKIL